MSDGASTRPGHAAEREWRVRAGGVLLLAAALFLWNAWGYDLWAPDEPFFGEGAREMLADGHWLVPHVGGVVNDHKPPLFFWLIALASLPMERVTSLSARLPSVLASLCTVALTLRLGRRLAGPRAGLAAGVVLATTLMPWEKARSAQIDAVLCFLVLLALSAFESLRAGDGGRRQAWLFWSACALAVLAKGPVGLLVPLGVVLTVTAWDRDFSPWRRLATPSALALAAGILAAWLVPASLWGGDYSPWGAVRRHVIERAAHGMHHAQPPWYYAGVLPVQLLPWTGFLPAALVLAWRSRSDRGIRFLVACAGFVVLFFSLFVEKRNLYVLPAFPALAILIALALAPPEGSRSPPLSWILVPQAATGLAMMLAGVAVVLLARGDYPQLMAPAAAVAASALAGGVAMVAAAFSRHRRACLVSTAAAMAVTCLVATSVVFPAIDPIKSSRGLSQRLLAAAHADGSSVAPRAQAYRMGNVPVAIAFYTGGLYLKETEDPAEALLALAGGAAIVTEERYLDELRHGGELHVLPLARQARRTVVLAARSPLHGPP